MANICNITDCNLRHLAKGYCSKHYYRAKRGHNPNESTRFDRRPCRRAQDNAYLQLAKNRGEAIVDIINDHLESHNWSLDGYGYPCSYISGTMVKLHHLIVGKPPEGKVTDHINRNKLDNRRKNLRFVTQRENLLNGVNPLKAQIS